MTQPINMSLVAIDDISSPTDRFACRPLSAKLTAKSCVERQAIVRAGTNQIQFSSCANCPDGKRVEGKIGAVDATEKATAIVKEQRARWRRASSAGHATARHKRALKVIQEDAPEPDEPTVPTLGHTMAKPTLVADPLTPEERAEFADDPPRSRRAAWTPEKREEQSRKCKEGWAKKQVREAMPAEESASEGAGMRTVTKQELIDSWKESLSGSEAAGKAESIVESMRAQADDAAKESSDPAEPEKEVDMAKRDTSNWKSARCTETGCGKMLRPGALKGPPPAGTETMCKLHRASYLAEHRPPKTTHPKVGEEADQLRRLGRSRNVVREDRKREGFDAVIARVHDIRTAKQKVMTTLATLSLAEQVQVLAEALVEVQEAAS